MRCLSTWVCRLANSTVNTSLMNSVPPTPTGYIQRLLARYSIHQGIELVAKYEPQYMYVLKQKESLKALSVLQRLKGCPLNLTRQSNAGITITFLLCISTVSILHFPEKGSSSQKMCVCLLYR
jgi:hypothetical protein